MIIIWSQFASRCLRDIYSYHKEMAGKRVADKLKSRIYLSTRQLIDQPLSGPVEDLLKDFQYGHRYIVTGNYKIIYRKIDEGILITDVFDTRQNPDKINNPHR